MAAAMRSPKELVRLRIESRASNSTAICRIVVYLYAEPLHRRGVAQLHQGTYGTGWPARLPSHSVLSTRREARSRSGQHPLSPEPVSAWGLALAMGGHSATVLRQRGGGATRAGNGPPDPAARSTRAPCRPATRWAKRRASRPLGRAVRRARCR